MKKSIKIVLILFLILSIFTISNNVFATEFDYKDYKPNQTGDSTKIQTMAGNVLGIVRNVGVAVAIVTLTIIGVKYMIGSVEQKAEYKKSMIPFVVGVIILASSTTLVSVIYDVTISAQRNTNLPTITDRDRYKYGFEQGNAFIQSGPTEEEIDAEFEWAQEQYNNATDPNKKEYYRGYLAGLNT